VGEGFDLLQSAAVRILRRYLERAGFADVQRATGHEVVGKNIDLVYTTGGSTRRVKVKADPYYGTDQHEIGDRALTFYRGDVGSFALEAVSNALTREPGWMFSSDADELFYYYLAIGQPEDEVAALMNESDDIFFSELKVMGDDLRILPMKATRSWFEGSFEKYTPRPVMAGPFPSWYRLVPRSDVERAVSGVRNVGPVFRSLAS